ncbi:MAG TPA: hypothetical protein VFU05_08420 [Cyclobacteriaceae bacterium]|nr:hypothetical protein [Cyclobacteriaceae bacterium]
MSLEEKRRLILALDTLIRSRSRGTTIEYAKRLGISKSTFFRLLDYIRNELNAPIVYDHAVGRYVYEVEGSLFFGFLPFSVLSKEELKKLNGGAESCTPASVFGDFFPVSTGGTDFDYTYSKVSCRD